MELASEPRLALNLIETLLTVTLLMASGLGLQAHTTQVGLNQAFHPYLTCKYRNSYVLYTDLSGHIPIKNKKCSFGVLPSSL